MRLPPLARWPGRCGEGCTSRNAPVGVVPAPTHRTPRNPLGRARQRLGPTAAALPARPRSWCLVLRRALARRSCRGWLPRVRIVVPRPRRLGRAQPLAAHDAAWLPARHSAGNRCSTHHTRRHRPLVGFTGGPAGSGPLSGASWSAAHAATRNRLAWFGGTGGATQALGVHSDVGWSHAGTTRRGPVQRPGPATGGRLCQPDRTRVAVGSVRDDRPP